MFALTVAIKSIEDLGFAGPLSRWRLVRNSIHDEICRNAFDQELNSFVQCYGAKHVDASLLMLPSVGFLLASDPKMKGTVEAVQRRLVRDGFVDRYPTMPELDGLPSGEGAFLLCTFWRADNLALQGRNAEAREIFERVLEIRNDVGLLSEEYDPESRRLVGNFPQAFSHVGLINTARNLAAAGGPAEKRSARSRVAPGS
jgi:GH15 family glucan-1,4-alpha-glucosidase